MHDQFTSPVIQRAEHRDLFGLPPHRNAPIGSRLRPGAGQIGMGQRLTFVAEEPNDVAGFVLPFEKLQTQADPLDLLSDLSSFQRVPRI